MTHYKAIHLRKRPESGIVIGETFETKQHPVPTDNDLKDGEVVFQPYYLSIDPAMRGWLMDRRSYVPPVKIGEVMRGQSVGRIVASKSKKLPTGSYGVAMSGWTELAKLKDRHVAKVDPDTLQKRVRLVDTLGVLGLTGLTAYFGILDVGNVKTNDFVVISGAAGATGSIVGQICKLKGARVLGLAGTDDKCKWLTQDLGFDQALNYKDPNFAENFRVQTKSLIDVFFDNVGGDILDMALARAKEHSRFVLCGGISQYNSAVKQGPKNYLMIISMRIRMQGFIVTDYEAKFPEAKKELAQWLSEGKIKAKETVIRGGLSKAEGAMQDLYKGINTGKLIVEITPQNKANL